MTTRAKSRRSVAIIFKLPEFEGSGRTISSAALFVRLQLGSYSLIMAKSTPRPSKMKQIVRKAGEIRS